MKHNKYHHPGSGRERLLAALLATAYGLLAMLLFFSRLPWAPWQLSGIATVSFMFLVPFAMGLISSCYRFSCRGRGRLQHASIALLPVLALFTISVLLQKGMVLYALAAFPAYAFMAILGGLIGTVIVRRKKLLVYTGVLMPFFIAPIEHYMGPRGEIYSETADVVISSAVPMVWQNIARVEAVEQEDVEERSLQVPFLPHPVKAAFDTLAPGGKRKAVFDQGLVFTEKITALVPRRYLAFDIQADTASRTNSPLERSIIIDGAYFGVISGEFSLEPIGQDRTRLRLTTHYRLSTHFNLYGRIWAGMALSRIQESILQVIRLKSEDEQSDRRML